MPRLSGILYIRSFPHHNQLSAHFTDEKEESWERLRDLAKITNNSDNNTSFHGLGTGMCQALANSFLCISSYSSQSKLVKWVLFPSLRIEEVQAQRCKRPAWSPGPAPTWACPLSCPVPRGLRQLYVWLWVDELPSLSVPTVHMGKLRPRDSLPSEYFRPLGRPSGTSLHLFAPWH